MKATEVTRKLEQTKCSGQARRIIIFVPLRGNNSLVSGETVQEIQF